MTNVFGINVTRGQKADREAGEAFVVQTVTDEAFAAIETAQEKNENFKKKGALPLFFSIIQLICAVVWMIVFIGILRSEVGLAEGYQNAPYLFWAGGICFVIWLALLLLGKLRASKVEKSKAFCEYNKTLDELEDKLCAHLSVPKEAVYMDVLVERYVMKNGVPKHKDFGMTAYENQDFLVYAKDDALCLSDLRQVWAIPLVSLRSMKLQKKRVSFPSWNKPEPPNSERYKKYKITANQFGHRFARYYRIEIRDVQGDFYLLIPQYEGEPFQKITGLRESAEA